MRSVRPRAAARARSWCTNARHWSLNSDPKRKTSRAHSRRRPRRPTRCLIWRDIGNAMGTLASELALHADRIFDHTRVYVHANVPARLVAFMRDVLHWD